MPLETELPKGSGVLLVDPTKQPDWDDQVLQLLGAGFFHTTAWARVLHATYGYRPYYLATPASGPLNSVLPLMEVASWLTGRRGVSPRRSGESPC